MSEIESGKFQISFSNKVHPPKYLPLHIVIAISCTSPVTPKLAHSMFKFFWSFTNMIQWAILIRPWVVFPRWKSKYLTLLPPSAPSWDLDRTANHNSLLLKSQLFVDLVVYEVCILSFVFPPDVGGDHSTTDQLGLLVSKYQLCLLCFRSYVIYLLIKFHILLNAGRSIWSFSLWPLVWEFHPRYRDLHQYATSLSGLLVSRKWLEIPYVYCTFYMVKDDNL